MQIAVIINGHREGQIITRTIVAAMQAASVAQKSGHTVKLLCVLDNADELTTAAVKALRVDIVPSTAGDLGVARNIGIEYATDADYVAFCDGDDLFGANWLARAAACAEKRGHAVYHPEYNFFFENANKLHRHIGTDHESFNRTDLIQYNPWSALCFAPRDLLMEYPYKPCVPGFGFEDLQFHLDTLADDVPHYVVPETLHAIRMKDPINSLCARKVAEKVMARKSRVLDIQRPPSGPEYDPPKEIPAWVPNEIQTIHEIEPLAWLNTPVDLRWYPRTKLGDLYWKMHDAWPEGSPVVLAPWMGRGGSEKAVLSVLRALGESTLFLTNVGPREWLHLLPPKCTLVDFAAEFEAMSVEDRAIILQRLVVQKRPLNLIACNTGLGVAVMSDCAEAFRHHTKLAVMSFNDAREGARRFSPLYWYIDRLLGKAAFISDNCNWLRRLRKLYDPASIGNFHALRFPVELAHVRRRHGDDSPAYFWAARNSHEKGPDIAKSLGVDMYTDFATFDALPLEKYNAMVLTSRSEGMPQTILEAAARGLPTLSLAVGGVAEFLPKELVFKNPAELAAAMRSMTSTELRSYGDNLQKKVLSENTQESFRIELLRILNA